MQAVRDIHTLNNNEFENRMADNTPAVAPTRRRRSRWATDDEDTSAKTDTAGGASGYVSTTPANTRRSRWTVIDAEKDNNLASDLVKLIQQQLATPTLSQVMVPSTVSLTPEEHRKVVILHAQVEELARRIESPHLYLDAIPIRERSPSPAPVYDTNGIRINKRDQRYKEKATSLRNKKIEEIRKLIPTYTVAGYVRERPSCKVPIPVDEYPTYNFSGLIIGPRGATHRRMEAETRCKISVRGRLPNDTKAKKNEYSDQPAHVYIEGDTEDDVNRAAEIVRQLLTVLDDEVNEHKARQLQELALYNGFVRESDLKRQKQQQRQQQLNDAGIAMVVCSHCGSTSHVTRDCTLKHQTSVISELSTMEDELKGGYGVSRDVLMSSSTREGGVGSLHSASHAMSHSMNDYGHTVVDLTTLVPSDGKRVVDLTGLDPNHISNRGGYSNTSGGGEYSHTVLDLTTLVPPAVGSGAGYSAGGVGSTAQQQTENYAGVDPATLAYISEYYQYYGVLPPGYTYDYESQQYKYDPLAAAVATPSVTVPDHTANPPPTASPAITSATPTAPTDQYMTPSPAIHQASPSTYQQAASTPVTGPANHTSAPSAPVSTTITSLSKINSDVSSHKDDDFEPPAPPGTTPAPPKLNPLADPSVPTPPGLNDIHPLSSTIESSSVVPPPGAIPPPPAAPQQAAVPPSYPPGYDPYSAYYYHQQQQQQGVNYGYGGGVPMGYQYGSYPYVPPAPASSVPNAAVPPPPAAPSSSSTSYHATSNPQLAAYMSQINNAQSK